MTTMTLKEAEQIDVRRRQEEEAASVLWNERRRKHQEEAEASAKQGRERKLERARNVVDTLKKIAALLSTIEQDCRDYALVEHALGKARSRANRHLAAAEEEAKA
jgi:hypothetical protein